MSDPQKYRSKEELEEYQNIDPIERLKTYILDKDIAGEEELEKIQDKIEDTVLEAIDFAEDSPFPEDDALYEDMFAGEPHFHK